MTRFENLEFEDADGAAKKTAAAGPKPTGTPVRTASYFKDLADQAYLRADYESALKFYSRALEDDHTLFSCWFGQVRMLIELGEVKEANLWSDKALELFPNHPDLLSAKALCALRMGLLQQSLAYSDNALSQRTPSPYCWLVRGEVLLSQNSKMSEHCFSQALAHCDSPQKKGRIALELSKVYRRGGQYSKALSQAQDAIRVFPKDYGAWLEFGTCQALLGQPQAEQSLTQALTLSPDPRAAKAMLETVKKRGLFKRIRSLFARSE